ncbi:MAG: DUF2203 domain-containing protein [Candidatus Eisenbacteria bacterium]
MQITLYTVEEANQHLVELRPRLERLLDMKREFDKLETRLAVLMMATAGASPDNPDARDMAVISEKRRRLGELIGRGIGELSERGVLVKDLDRGLVDFYALSGDRLIFLCWHIGEAELSHWHTLDGGFNSRQPLKEAGLDES